MRAGMHINHTFIIYVDIRYIYLPISDVHLMQTYILCIYILQVLLFIDIHTHICSAN